MGKYWGLVIVLALLVGCRADPGLPATPTTSPMPTASVAVPVPSPSPTAFVSPAETASPPRSPLPTPTRAATPAPTPVSPTEELWVEPRPRPLPAPDPAGEPTRLVPNASRTFWVVEPATGGRRQVTARLRVQTPHAAMWVEKGVWHDVRKLESAAGRFETNTYPRIHAVFGSEWSPGIDHDPRIAILHVANLGDDVLGYASTLDEYPSEVHRWSNEAELITVNLNVVDVGSPAYETLLVRELVRLVQWHGDRNETRWVREGLAELAASLAGSESGEIIRAYVQEPDTPLTTWTGTDSQRGAAYLLAAYFHQRFGDEGSRALTAHPANGMAGFSGALEELETGTTFRDLFLDWLAANYLDAVVEADDGRETYLDLELPELTPSAVYDDYPVQVSASVHQYGADYILLRGEEDLHVEFSGRDQTRLFAGQPQDGGEMWWSNRADESLTTLEGEFDLRSVDRATLTYRVWYDIETDYDYAMVAISAEGSERWQTLRVPSGTNADPYGNNPGWGYTGASSGWITEELDISAWAGTEARVRFSYLTDGAITGPGLLLDDVSIPEIDWQGDGATQGDQTDNWSSEGFVLTDGLVQQEYLALLIRRGREITVERLPVEEGQTAEWVIPLGSDDLEEAVLILSAAAPVTTQSAPYQLVIQP